MTIKEFMNEKVAICFKNAEQIKEFAHMCKGYGMTMAGDDKDAIEWMLNDPEVLFDGIKGINFFGANLLSNKYVFFTYNFDTMPGGLSWAGWEKPNCERLTEKGWKIIPFEEFKKNSEAVPYKIEISYDGEKVTTARMIVNGKVVKTAKARRNPEDKFDFKKGAEIAFARLFEREKKGFKIGDRVVISDIKKPACKYLNGKHGVIVDFELNVNAPEISPEPITVVSVKVDGGEFRRIYIERLSHE